MPYSTPSAVVPVPATPITHRRSPSSFSDERGPGAFAPLGALPRRRTPSMQKKTGPVFHIRDDDFDDDDSPEDDPQHNIPPALKLKPNNSFRLSLNTENLSPSFRPRNHHSPYKQHQQLPSVPFPRSSPLSPPPDASLPIPSPLPPRQSSPSSSPSPLTPPPTSQPPSPRPSVSRTSSTPILLSNGKPLKSSLKSSSSSPSISNDSPRPLHLRARSAPSTPNPDLLTTPKNVHFAEKDGGLETVLVFSRSAKPASLSQAGGDDTETETEGESSILRYNSAFPFPSFPPSPLALNTSTQLYELDPASSSQIPAPNPPAYANIHLESLALSPRAPSAAANTPHAPALTGTLIVRNIAYEKHVALRFTLDDWQTTSEVSARHIASLTALPPALVPRTLGDAAAALATKEDGAWDRFAFTIRLEDYAFKLNERVLWLVARFSTGIGGGEWWDNNSGANYKVGFMAAAPPAGRTARQVALSAPAVIPNTQTQAQAQAPPQQPTASQPTPPSPPTHPQPSPAAIATTQRLSKFSLKNYAAPSTPPARAPTALPVQTATPPATPQLEPTALPHTPPASSSNESTPTQTPAPATQPSSPKKVFIGGQPVTVPSHTHGFGGGNGFGLGMGGITLHWPWGRGQGQGLGHGAGLGQRDEVQSPVVEKLQAQVALGGTHSPRRYHSPPSSASSSRSASPSLSPSASFATLRAPTRPTTTSPPKSPSSSSLDSTSTSESDVVVTPGGGSDGEMDSDSLYKAFVRQWCFAQGPPPALGGSGGVVVG